MKRYDSYKDSGIKWIGEIPSHWKCSKYKYYFESGMGETILREDLTENGEIPVFSATESDKIFGYVDEAKLILQKNDLVIPARGNSIGHLMLVEAKATCTQTTIYYKNKSLIDSKFAFYFAKGNKDMLFQFDNTAIPQITVNQVKNNVVLIPSSEEQTTIANYLDHKTTQIDHLIVKKEQFIQLLEEERVAVINQAVTKGLDLTVPMKDSGIEWLGVIPKHWEVKQVRYLLEEGKEGIKIGPFGSSLKLDFMTDKGYKVYGQENVIKNDFNKGAKYIDESKYNEMVNYTISSGDIVITMMGTAGLAKVVPNDFEPGIMDSHLTRVRVNKSKFSNRLFELLINDSYLIKSQVKFHSKGSIMGGLNSSIIKSFILPTPEIDEQLKILAFIEKSILQNQEIMNKTKQEIELLKEYKTALISEVVTGKVDVRNEKLN